MSKDDANFVAALVVLAIAAAVAVTVFLAGILLFNLSGDDSVKLALASTAFSMGGLYLLIDAVVPKE